MKKLKARLENKKRGWLTDKETKGVPVKAILTDKSFMIEKKCSSACACNRKQVAPKHVTPDLDHRKKKGKSNKFKKKLLIPFKKTFRFLK